MIYFTFKIHIFQVTFYWNHQFLTITKIPILFIIFLNMVCMSFIFLWKICLFCIYFMMITLSVFQLNISDYTQKKTDNSTVEINYRCYLKSIQMCLYCFRWIWCIYYCIICECYIGLIYRRKCWRSYWQWIFGNHTYSIMFCIEWWRPSAGMNWIISWKYVFVLTLLF